MSRPLRIEFEEAFYHVIQRGLERREIFKQDQDYEQFLLYLTLASRSYGTKIHAHCLMSNHYHLLIETPRANLSKAMHAINTGYSVHYNKRYRRVGPLYQGRYKAYLVEQDEYLHHLSRYIHLNPIRAKVVERLEDYKWSSYRGYIKGAGIIEGAETGFVLGMFGKGKEDARKQYKRFVEDEVDIKGNILRENTIKGIVIGGIDFFKEIKEKYIDNRSDNEIPMIKDAKRVDDQDMRAWIEKEVENITKQEKQLLRRKLKIYFTRKYTQYELKTIARYFGGVTYSGVSQICRRIEQRRVKDKNFDRLLRKLEKKMSNVKT